MLRNPVRLWMATVKKMELTELPEVVDRYGDHNKEG
jgi:hypothetical protein